jgi:hypothetical protein
MDERPVEPSVTDDALTPAFTDKQYVDLDDVIQEHPVVQYLLKELLEATTKLTALEITVQNMLEKGVTAEAREAIMSFATGDTVLLTPSMVLPTVLAAAKRYVAETGNLGESCRRLITGEYLIDLADEEVCKLLPPGRPPAMLYQMCKETRKTRRVTEHEWLRIGWNERRPLALIIKPLV